MMTKAGFIALLGRPNAGKSTLLNALLREKIALVSHKANATRRALKAIVPFSDAQGVACQMIFLDTPGLTTPQKLLDRAMQAESARALQTCDLCVFVTSVHEGLQAYQDFLALCGDKPHIVALNKIDTLTHAQLLAKIQPYQAYNSTFNALVPLSATKCKNLDILLQEIAKLLPIAPFYYDPELISDAQTKEIYQEMIREQVFAHLSEEIPYASDVCIVRFVEDAHIDRIHAQIIVEKESQQKMVVGKGAWVIKKIGKQARLQMQAFGGKKVFLRLEVVVRKNWSQELDQLKKMGYMLE
ncbi:GTPase Era [Helicobacter salomonis]|uniref:GTPase Era n=1 Tax=Helicobacter salomonis TaxID=56878 RepID=UPI0018F8417C|nr:GTPase Era [Helicobacter salomonis]